MLTFRREPGHCAAADRAKCHYREIVKTVELEDIDLTSYIRAGDAVMWGQAAAEPLALTRALMQQRDRLGPLEVFIGATWSDSADPAFADRVRFRSYCGAGHNLRLAQSGVL